MPCYNDPSTYMNKTYSYYDLTPQPMTSPKAPNVNS